MCIIESYCIVNKVNYIVKIKNGMLISYRIYETIGNNNLIGLKTSL